MGKLWWSGRSFWRVDHVQEMVDNVGEDGIGKEGQLVNKVVRRVPLIKAVLENRKAHKLQ